MAAPPLDDEAVEAVPLCKYCGAELENIEWMNVYAERGPAYRQLHGRHLSVEAAEACRVIRKITAGART